MTGTSESHEQLRPGLWHVVNERYPGSMIRKDDIVPLAKLAKPISESKLCLLSSCGAQPKGTLPFDVVHPVGDFSFRRVPSDAKPSELEIHQIKYPTRGANVDLNVIFPIERLQELVAEGAIGSLTPNHLTFIGYNMAPKLVEERLAVELADAALEEGAEIALLAPA